MIGQGSGYYNESIFDYLAPPPYVAIGVGVLGFPVSSTRDLMASVTNVIAGVGFLAIIVLAMALYLFFWFVRQIIALSPRNKKRK